MKKCISLVLTVVLSLNMAATPVYAGDWFSNIVDDVTDTVKKGADWIDGATDDTVNWINNASEDTKEWLNTASDDTVNWINNASDDTKNWLNTASDDTLNWVDNASDDTLNWLDTASDDTLNWIDNASDDTKNWLNTASEDTLNWVDNASEDTLNWLDRASEDTLNWVDNASEDTLDWLDTASEDTLDWLETATDDVGGFLEGISSGIKTYRRPDKPSINGTFAQMADIMPQEAIDAAYINIMSEEIGAFSELENIKERRLPQEAQDKIKNKLMDLGVSEYWSKFAVGKVSNASEDTSVGDIIESCIPFDFLLNGMVANEIDDIVAEYGFEEIDKTTLIQPDSPIQGLKFKYTAENLQAVNKPSYVIFRGITSIGYRDSIKVEFISGGITYPAQAFVKDDRLGFYAKVDRIENLSILLTNTFDRPTNIPLDIAQGFQETVNDLAPFGKPISDKATKDIAEFLGDNETVYKETTKDKHGNKKHEVKKMPSLNEIYANGDVGKIVATTLYTIPVVGDVLAFLFKGTGNDATLENIVRDIVNQKEVKTFVKIENPELLILEDLKSLTGINDGSGTNTVTLDIPTEKVENIKDEASLGGEEQSSGVPTTSYAHEFDTYPAMTAHFGNFTLNRAYDHSIYASSPINSTMLMTFNDVVFSDGEAETKITIYDPVSGLENFAGLAFRVSEVNGNSRIFNGYSAVLMPAVNGQDAQVVLYKHTGSRKEILDSETFALASREAYTLTVKVKGSSIKVYLNGSKVLSANDDAYISGGVGFTSSAIPAIYQNIIVEN